MLPDTLKSRHPSTRATASEVLAQKSRAQRLGRFLAQARTNLDLVRGCAPRLKAFGAFSLRRFVDTMPLAQSNATDCLYSRHVNPQWVKLLNVLELSVSYEHCVGAELFTRDGRRILDFLSGYCVHNVGHNHPEVVSPSWMSCKGAAPSCCKVTFQNWRANWPNVFVSAPESDCPKYFLPARAAKASRPLSSFPAPITGERVCSKTMVNFTLGDVLHTVHGVFDVKHGALHFNPATNKISGEILVDATSGRRGSDRRDKKMHQQILESAHYPDIVFRPDRVYGQLVVQGTSRSVCGTQRA